MGSPMDDDDPSKSASKLPWLWIIEFFAGVREISNSTLQGLIDAAPVGPDDFCENTKELVALRCLEQLSGYDNGVVDCDASSSLDSRVGFDFSRSCEDILQEILNEIPLSNLKMAGAELLKRDVHPFIMHKRAGTIKCHLEQLKDSILEGTHPHIDHLKERSGLSLRNRGYTVHDECNDHLEKDNGNSTYAENIGAKEKSASLILENGNKSSKEHLLDNNFLPSKRNRVYSADEHFMGCRNEKQVCINECDELLRNTKRIKSYAPTNFGSKKEKPVSQLKMGVSENSTETIHLMFEKGGHATMRPQRKSVEENCQQQQVEPITIDVALPYGTQHKTCGSEPWSKHKTDSQLEDPNGSQQTVAADKAQDDTDNDCGVEISGDRIVYQGEKNNLLMKKHEEQNLGMKCNEGGRLLVCDASHATTFPSVVPESCVGVTNTIMPQNTSGAEPCQNTSLDDISDTVHPVEPIPTNDGDADDTDKIQHIINESQPKQKEPNAASLNVSQKQVAGDRTVVGTGNGCGAELSSDSAGYHNEKIDLAAKKHEFLSSQCAFGQDLSAVTDSTEQNLCMKCNEGGQLLVCKTINCPLVVHKSCLEVYAQLEANGNFFCPFCAYSHAISEYLEAKKKASLARKELAIFINKRGRNQATEPVHEFQRQEHSLSRNQLTGCGDNREDHVGEHVNEVIDLQFERSQQQAPISCVHSSCREKENVNNGLIEVLREEEMSNSKSLTGGRVEENKVPADHVDGHGGDKFSSKNSNVVSANQSNAGEEIPQEMMKQHNMNGTGGTVCAQDTGKEKISEDVCEKHVISRYSLRSQKHKTEYKPRSSPQLRR